MPTKQLVRPSMQHKKRHGLHHNQGKHYIKVYWPYMPLLLIIMLGMIVSLLPSYNQGTLAYATNVSQGSLLAGTNQVRAINGSGSLTLNSQLNAAAQTKANDMTTRDYWSHNTPEGNEPWVFITQAGYQYQKAGENLAYGFTTSDATIQGWMNSPAHKANMLDSAFSEVGFGFANSSDYQSNGEVTVVVAMYGTPLVAAAPVPIPSTQATKPSTIQKTPTPTPAPTPAPSVAEAVPINPVAEIAQATPALEVAKEEQPVTTLTPVVAATAKPVSRLQAWTKGTAPWASFAVGILSGAAIGILVLKHALALRKLVLKGEIFFLHHPIVDAGLIALVVLGLYLGQTTGFIV